MELQEQVVHRVRAKTDRYSFWLKFFSNPIITCPAITAIIISPSVALKLGGALGAVGWTMGLVSLLVYAYSRSDRPYDVAHGAFFRPVWTAFCAAVQGRKEWRYEHLHMKPMHKDNAQWRALIENEAQAYRCLRHPLEIKTQEDWIALRTIEYLVEEGGKTLVWEE